MQPRSLKDSLLAYLMCINPLLVFSLWRSFKIISEQNKQTLILSPSVFEGEGKTSCTHVLLRYKYLQSISFLIHDDDRRRLKSRLLQQQYIGMCISGVILRLELPQKSWS